MARTITLGELKTLIRQSADMENSSFISDSELTRYINQSATELYGLMVTAYGEDYICSETSITVPANQEKVALPANFLKLLKAEYRPANQRPIPLKQFMLAEKYLFYNYGTNFNFRFRIMGNNFYLNRSPLTDTTIYLFYIPAFTNLSSDSDTFDGYNGWEQYIVADVCCKILAKEESDFSFHLNQKMDLKKRIEEEIINRTLNEPQRSIYLEENDYDEDIF